MYVWFFRCFSSWQVSRMSNPTMEDTWVTELVKDKRGKKYHVFGVFNGHGGKETSKFIKDNVLRVFKTTLYDKRVNIFDKA